MASAHTMTPDEARHFTHQSEGNARKVEKALSCGCKPYEDVFTYNRWQAQGMQVQRGQKSIRLTTFISYTDTVEQDGHKSEVTKKRPNKASVFCRCQVKPKD